MSFHKIALQSTLLTRIMFFCLPIEFIYEQLLKISPWIDKKTLLIHIFISHYCLLFCIINIRAPWEILHDGREEILLSFLKCQNNCCRKVEAGPRQPRGARGALHQDDRN